MCQQATIDTYQKILLTITASTTCPQNNQTTIYTYLHLSGNTVHSPVCIE